MKDQILDVKDVASALYVGRTSFPERRLLQHYSNADRDHLLVLHWAACWPEVEYFEERLIEAFSYLNRVGNESLTSEGAHSSPWSVLYVSFALKHAIPVVPGSTAVFELHWRDRLWPDPAFPSVPTLLRADLELEDAVAELERFKSQTFDDRSDQKRRVRKRRDPTT
jgi:hypothetical protein